MCVSHGIKRAARNNDELAYEKPQFRQTRNKGQSVTVTPGVICGPLIPFI